jgi:hypothetical protein
VAGAGERRGQGYADIAGSDDRDLHRMILHVADWLSASVARATILACYTAVNTCLRRAKYCGLDSSG